MMKRVIEFFRFIFWRLRHLSPRQNILFLALITGMATGLAAVILKNIVHLTSIFIFSRMNIGEANLLYLAFPYFGILLTVLFLRTFIKEPIGHGISRVLWAISRNKGQIKKHNMYSSMVGSTFTIAFGGSVGLEAPVVYTGSAIGSNLARWFELNYKMTVLLIACGATGAIAGIFKAPIAATVFALEVLMLDLTMWSIIPLLISAVTGAMVSYLFMGSDVVFSFSVHETFNSANIPFYILLGIICGFVALYFSRGLALTELYMKKIKNAYYKALVGGLLLGLIIFVLPPLFGEGYTSLKEMLGGNPSDVTHGSMFYSMRDNIWVFSIFLLLIIIFKAIATGVTTGSGGVGGVFAPSLFLGGITGFFVSRVINSLNIFHYVSERNFALVGMAGVMAGIMHAPLTSIFLIAELTNGYELFIPLIITSTLAYLTHRLFEPFSVYTRKLAERGELITHHKDKAVLTLIKVEDVLDKSLIVVKPEDTLGDLVNNIKKTKRNIFPVIEKDGKLLGIVSIDDIRDLIFRYELYYTVKVSSLVLQPPFVISINDSMIEVMKNFEKEKVWHLPVVDAEGRYQGMVSKAGVLSFYRDKMVESSNE